jgi:hypothetical protein
VILWYYNPVIALKRAWPVDQQPGQHLVDVRKSGR